MLPNSHQPKQYWADSRVVKIKVNPTKVRELMRHPVDRDRESPRNAMWEATGIELRKRSIRKIHFGSFGAVEGIGNARVDLFLLWWTSHSNFGLSDRLNAIGRIYQARI